MTERIACEMLLKATAASCAVLPKGGSAKKACPNPEESQDREVFPWGKEEGWGVFDRILQTIY